MKGFERTPPELRWILRRRIDRLGLKLQGSPVERFVLQLQRELRRKGITRFQAVCYLTDEWGCPDRQPIIGIPFYLADPKLAKLEKKMNDLEDARKIMKYLRHEAGHAFNYAYRLFETPRWRDLFGPFRRPYREDYRPLPFSRRYVRHLEGWYAQKHPDEDFAETFAVWLTPASRWQRRYRGWPAMRKLQYVDGVCRRLGPRAPIVDQGRTDVTVSEMKETVREFYRRMARQNRAQVKVGLADDLSDIFGRRPAAPNGLVPAARLIQPRRAEIIDKVATWTGVRHEVVRALMETILRHCREKKLMAVRRREDSYLVELTAYATALAMNYLERGHFVLK
jgi:hypothetical protein